MESNQNFIRANKQPVCNTTKTNGAETLRQLPSEQCTLQGRNPTKCHSDAHPDPQTMAPRAVTHSSDSTLESP